MNTLTTADRELEIMRNLEQDHMAPAQALEKEGLLDVDMEVSSRPWETDEEDQRWEGEGGAIAETSHGVTIIDGTQPKVKDYQTYENNRNKQNTQLYRDMIQAAFGEMASEIIIAHHLNFEHGSDIGTINEIPSADTMIFDHEIMGRIFGMEMALKHMMLLASIPCDKRDGVLKVLFYSLRGGKS